MTLVASLYRNEDVRLTSNSDQWLLWVMTIKSSVRWIENRLISPKKSKLGTWYLFLILRSKLFEFLKLASAKSCNEAPQGGGCGSGWRKPVSYVNNCSAQYAPYIIFSLFWQSHLWYGSSNILNFARSNSLKIWFLYKDIILWPTEATYKKFQLDRWD